MLTESPFYACFHKFKECKTQRSSHNLNYEYVSTPHRGHHLVFGYKREEYMTDFCLISKRTLTAEEHQLFSFHFLLGADSKACCQRLKISRAKFFSTRDGIEEKLDHAFQFTAPYPLFPTERYFAASTQVASAFTPAPAMPQPLRPPLA